MNSFSLYVKFEWVNIVTSETIYHNKVHGNICKGEHCHIFCQVFASLLQWVLLLKKRICSELLLKKRICSEEQILFF